MNEIAGIASELQSQFDIWLHRQIFENQFLIAGIGTLLLGLAGYVLRAVPVQIWAAAKRAFTLELVINNDNEAFQYLMRYLQEHRIGWLQRTFLLGARCLQDNTTSWIIGPGYGASIFFFEGRPIIGRLSVEKSDSYSFKMSIELRFLGRSQNRVHRFVAAMQQHAWSADRTGIEMWSCAHNQWHLIASNKRRRPLESVFLPLKDKEQIIERLTWFYANENWFRQRGLAYKLGVLLSGQPGCGKSSLIHALASEFDKNIRLLNLNLMSDSSLQMLASLSDRDFLVIEDIDTFSVARQRAAPRRYRGAPPQMAVGVPVPEEVKPEAIERDDEKWGVSLSTVLNVLDGLISPDGVVTIATTNHPELLDPALLRKGRFDLHVHVGPLDEASLRSMYEAYYGPEQLGLLDTALAGRAYRPIVGAEAQDLFRHLPPADALSRL